MGLGKAPPGKVLQLGTKENKKSLRATPKQPGRNQEYHKLPAGASRAGWDLAQLGSESVSVGASAWARDAQTHILVNRKLNIIRLVCARVPTTGHQVFHLRLP
jgi:hypothetical protein